MPRRPIPMRKDVRFLNHVHQLSPALKCWNIRQAQLYCDSRSRLAAGPLRRDEV